MTKVACPKCGKRKFRIIKEPMTAYDSQTHSLIYLIGLKCISCKKKHTLTTTLTNEELNNIRRKSHEITQ